MKRTLANLANRLFEPFGFKLVGSKAVEFTMSSMLARLRARGVSFGTVVDIGASDGKWSLACMKHFPQARYLAIEALEERAAALETVRRTHPTFDYEICIAGAADGGEASITVSDDLDGSTVNAGEGGQQRTCPVRSVDALLGSRSLAGPCLLKFDTHGFELPILAGCSATLANTEAIIMECYNFKLTQDTLRFHEMCAHMETLGFRCADIADPLLRPHDRAFWQIDILFLSVTSPVFGHDAYE